MKTTPITSAEDHRHALQEIERLWNAAPGSADEVRVEELVTAVEAFEAGHFKEWDKTPTRD